MSKKSKGKRSRAAAAGPAGRTVAPPRMARHFRLSAAALCALCLLSAGYAATRYDAVRVAVGMRPLIATASPQQGQLPLAKEYIYAGGRLVATEEPTPVATPTPTPAGPLPTNFTAKSTSASSVEVKWNAPSSGNPTGYIVERRGPLAAQLVEIPLGASATLYNDTLQPGDNAYLYRVKAVYPGGSSAYTDYDLATTISFTDESLQGAAIKAAHLMELRRAVRAVRILAGSGEPTWGHPDPISTPASARRAIYLADVTDLRTQLDGALQALDAALGVTTFNQPYPASPPLEQYGTVYAAHFEQIRARVR